MRRSGTQSSQTTSNSLWRRRHSARRAFRSTVARFRLSRCSSSESNRSARMSSSRGMFTGLIEAVGHVDQVVRTGTGVRLGVRTELAGELTDGESVSVNGVCLTVAELTAGMFAADIGPETARVTTLGGLQPGHPVNLERALRADGRFGGHFVQGHVDGLGTVRDLRAEGDAHWLKVGYSPSLAPYL